MVEVVMGGAISPFVEWQSFYAIIGPSAAALTGLQFVVVAIGSQITEIKSDAMQAFGTPTIVHFCAVLGLAAVMAAPWHTVAAPESMLVVLGVLGFLYAVWIVYQASRQKSYNPVFEDWLWHCALPALAYAGLAIAAVVLKRAMAESLFVIAGAVFLLLLVGIHNAWDSVIYIATTQRRKDPETSMATDRAGDK